MPLVTCENTRIIIFAKQPIPGYVKTRLMPVLDAQKCAQLSEKLCQHTIDVAVTAGYPIHLFCDPTPEHTFFLRNQRQYDLHLHQQCGENLTQKLQAAFRLLFTSAQRVIAIGSDCPVMTSTYLQAAVDGLEHAEVVLGPAEDGGYVLIGMRQFYPELFEDIPWSSERVLQVTQERIQSQNLSYLELPILWDVDTSDDFARLENL